MTSLVLWAKRHKRIRNFVKWVMSASLPVPRAFRPIGHALYLFTFGCIMGARRFAAFFWFEPLLRSRCEIGKRLVVYVLPDIGGHVKVIMGDDVKIWGKIGIMSGRVFDEPRLTIGSNVALGNGLQITCNRQIDIEDGVLISTGVRIADTDGHPLDPVERAAGKPAPPEACKPVRIGKNAWIGASAIICKGVTIGEDAVVGAGAVVTRDVPAGCIVAGNPAQIVRRAAAAPGGPMPAEG